MTPWVCTLLEGQTLPVIGGSSRKLWHQLSIKTPQSERQLLSGHEGLCGLRFVDLSVQHDTWGAGLCRDQ